ncbi:MAG: DUF998 domain-containing protein [Proteobacteria bacterium]|nr:DUF998 domain-containing protein [Pseudomonadota bacterium]
MPKAGTSIEDASQTISYHLMRFLIGLVGLLLPTIIVIWSLIVFFIYEGDFQASVSDYYYTALRNIFVGSLCAIGVFLLSYRGPNGEDKNSGIVAGLAALAVALFPTDPPMETDLALWQEIVNTGHDIAAIILFIMFARFCLCLFTKTDKSQEILEKTPKGARNKSYKFCGRTILVCIALILVNWLLTTFAGIALFTQIRPVLILEIVAIYAFAISWMTKSEALWLSDKPGE